MKFIVSIYLIAFLIAADLMAVYIDGKAIISIALISSSFLIFERELYKLLGMAGFFKIVSDHFFSIKEWVANQPTILILIDIAKSYIA